MDLEFLDSMMTAGQPGSVARKTGGRMDEMEINIARADLIRQTMEGIRNSKDIS
jgi:protein-arginine kinase